MSINLGEVTATTLKNRSPEVVDNVSNHNALLDHLRKRGKWDTEDGGRTIDEPITYSENSTVKFYDGAQESFSIPIEENIDAATYDWKFQGGFIYYTEAEKVKNSGKHKAVRLMETKINNLKSSLANSMGSALYSAGTVSKEPGGLQFLVSDDPTAAGTVGGIDQNAQSFWRNKYSAAAATTSSNIKSRMNSMYLSILRGSDRPDIILADDDMFTYYWDSLSDLQRFTSSEKADTTNHQALRYQTAEVLYDAQCPDKHMYFLNCDHLRFVCAPDRKWKVGSARPVTNANYDVVPVFWAGNLTCSRRASHGVIIAS